MALTFSKVYKVGFTPTSCGDPIVCDVVKTACCDRPAGFEMCTAAPMDGAGNFLMTQSFIYRRGSDTWHFNNIPFTTALVGSVCRYLGFSVETSPYATAMILVFSVGEGWKVGMNGAWGPTAMNWGSPPYACEDDMTGAVLYEDGVYGSANYLEFV